MASHTTDNSASAPPVDAPPTGAHPAAPRRLDVLTSRALPALLPRPSTFDTIPTALADTAGRHITYLRLSVTDRCDLACVYCMPKSGEDDHAHRAELLSFEEVARLVDLFVMSGVRRVRLTGGEPLVRRDVVRLVERIATRHPDVALAMTTNATRLGELARPLRAAGLRSVNISIDTLDPALFRTITRGGELAPVLAGIHAARHAGLDVKLNTVLLGGINDHEVERLVDFAWSLGVVPRFIELMPLGEAAHLPSATFISAAAALAPLAHRLARPSDGAKNAGAGHGPARYTTAADGSGRRVGVISAVSDEFCGDCNRLRLTARGDLRPCLAAPEGLSLRDVLRAGGSDLELAWHLHSVLRTKAAGHGFIDASRDEHTRVGMSLVGG